MTLDTDDRQKRKDQGARLKVLREQRGMSAGDLGAELEVTRSTVFEWEGGRTRIAPARAVQIAAVLEVQPSAFMGEDWQDFDRLKLPEDEQVQADLFVQARLRALSESNERLEADLGAVRRELAAVRQLLEQQGAALMPLVTRQLQGAAERRQSAEAPPASEERRRTRGRRRNDPPR